MTQQEVSEAGAVPQTETPDASARTDDPTLIRETRSIPADREEDGGTDSLRSSRAVREERHATMLDRYGGMYWGTDFIGFAVAMFFSLVLLGIVGAIVGAVGYELGTPAPKIGGPVSGTMQNLGLGALVGSLVALLIAYFIGGYTAGRMARFSGAKNGLGVVLWTIIVAVVLGAAGAIAGNRFNVASQLHLKVDAATLTVRGAISLAVALVVMIVAAALGGLMGERYHRKIDRDAEALQ